MVPQGQASKWQETSVWRWFSFFVFEGMYFILLANSSFWSSASLPYFSMFHYLAYSKSFFFSTPTECRSSPLFFALPSLPPPQLSYHCQGKAAGNSYNREYPIYVDAPDASRDAPNKYVSPYCFMPPSFWAITCKSPILDLFNHSRNSIVSDSVFPLIFLSQIWSFSAMRNRIPVKISWKVGISFSDYRLEAGACWDALSCPVMSEWHLQSFLRVFSDFSHLGHKTVIPNPNISFLFRAERRKKGKAAGQLHLSLSS